MHYARVHPPGHYYASANRMHAATKASRADHGNAPDLSEPQEPRKLNSIVTARRAQLSQPAGHHDRRALVAEEFPVMGGQRIG